MGCAEVGLVAVWTGVRSLKCVSATYGPGKKGHSRTSPVWVNSCSASLDGLVYALSHPSNVHLNRLSVRLGGLDGTGDFDDEAAALACDRAGESSRAGLTGRGARSGAFDGPATGVGSKEPDCGGSERAKTVPPDMAGGGCATDAREGFEAGERTRSGFVYDHTTLEKSRPSQQQQTAERDQIGSSAYMYKSPLHFVFQRRVLTLSLAWGWVGRQQPYHRLSLLLAFLVDLAMSHAQYGVSEAVRARPTISAAAMARRARVYGTHADTTGSRARTGPAAGPQAQARRRGRWRWVRLGLRGGSSSLTTTQAAARPAF
jgi:hypothetical protein